MGLTKAPKMQTQGKPKKKKKKKKTNNNRKKNTE